MCPMEKARRGNEDLHTDRRRERGGKSSLTGTLKAERTDLGVIVDPDKITAELGGDEFEGGKTSVERIGKVLADG